MQINKRFYFLLILNFFAFGLWLLLRDRLLLNLWIALALILLISWWIACNSLIGVSVERKSRIKNQQIGGIFDERFLVENKSSTPKLWLEIIDHSPLSRNVNSRVIYGLKSRQVNLFSTTLILNKRGFFSLGPTEIRSGDPFGLFSTSLMIPNSDHLLVHPLILRFQSIPLISADKTGSENLRLQTIQTTPQSAGVREYSPGDPLNRVHWRSTVKHQRLMVKEFDEEMQSSVWVFLDAQDGNYVRVEGTSPAAYDRNLAPLNQRKKYTLPDDSFEYAVCLAVSLANHYLIRSRFVGLACNADVVQIIPADKGSRQLTKILEGLAAAKDRGGLPLSQLLEKQIRNIPKGSALILVTSLLDQRLLLLIETLKRRGYSLMVLRINNSSFLPAFTEVPVELLKPLPDLYSIYRGSDLERIFS